MHKVIAVLACMTLALGCSSGNSDPSAGNGTDTGSATIRLRSVASGLNSPVYVAAPAGDARVFVVEQSGRIRIIDANGQLLSTPFLDITSKVSFSGERGLLSVAFHRNYSSNGFFYVDYTDRNGDTQIERYKVSASASVADPNSALTLLHIAQPFANHNGGLLLFGPDGKLYVGMGDGGSGGDPLGNGQNRNTLLGKILRIDVDAGNPYGIPAGNPYIGQSNARPEIWSIGMRNPWRFSFDSVTNQLYVADVGQNQYEEVNVVSATTAGLNYGWNITEGLHCYSSSNCSQAGLVQPVLEYTHSGGNCSVTGGFVYRGTVLTAVVGHYFYADYCAGWIKSFRYTGGQVTSERTWDVGNVGSITSFGLDSRNEMYVTSANGNVYKLVAS